MINSNNIGKILIAVVIAALFYEVYSQSDIWLRHQAIQQCLEVGYEEYNNVQKNSKSVVPNRKAYEFCIKEKGL